VRDVRPLVVVLAETLDPGLVEACGERPSVFCEVTWNVTHNRLLSTTIDWIITRPLAAIVILLVAFILNRWVRRAATALITRVTVPPAIAVGALELVGVTPAVDQRAQSRARTLSAVARATVSAFIWTIATLMVLGLFHINLGPLLAGAGIAGIAVGLGAQSLVRDCIAGFFILLEDQCGVGDEIDTGTVTGTVESLTLRLTQVRSADGTLWSLANGTLARVGNKNRNWSQGTVDILVGHDTNLDRAIELAHDAALEACAAPAVAEVILEPPSILGIERIDVNGTVMRISVRTKPGQQGPVLREIRLAVKRSLDAEGISLHPPAP
jgi:moderate conductance mechanosensitive channel